MGGGICTGGRDLAGAACGKAIGLMQSAWAVGYLLAALLAALVLPLWGWRPLFLAGVLPALATLWIRRNIPEPPKWTRPTHSLSDALTTLFRPPLFATCCSSRRCVLACCLGIGVCSPGCPLSLFAGERGGAGLSVVRSSAWIVRYRLGPFSVTFLLASLPTGWDGVRRFSLLS